MLEFFSIISKGGFILWSFCNDITLMKLKVNYLMDVLSDSRFDKNVVHEATKIDFYTNNKEKIIYIAGYPKSIDLPYVENFLKDCDKLFSLTYSGLEKPTSSLPVVGIDFTSYYENLLQHHESKFFGQKQSEKTQPIIRNSTPSKIMSTKKNKKSARSWDKNGKTIQSNDDEDILDYSNPVDKDYNPIKSQLNILKDNMELLNDRKFIDKFVQPQKSKFLNFFKGLVSEKVLSEKDLELVVEQIKDHLCSKNVAQDIASLICDSITGQLIGKQIGTFSGVKNVVRSTAIQAVRKILIPKDEINLIQRVEDTNQSKQRPYTIVFCGVNGVGKSTNLAKIANYLIFKKGYSISIAACDTFRSGAVEQLKVHMNRLNSLYESPNISLFEQGYGKDAAFVAKEAIKHAKIEKKNVVLIDTAGRMQDNEPLMRSLAKLIHENQPDLILFVGEALVGNDGVDQLRKFNSSLKEYSYVKEPHLIDGVVLTKFDTIDDKVGAALSMTYVTGKPIVFVGVGQTYNDIRSFDVENVVDLLFK